MTNWQNFLDRYAIKGDAGFQRNAPASPDEIQAVEAGLMIKLPPSYRAFLEASNGLRVVTEGRLGLRAVTKLKWFRKEHREWVNAYVMTASGVPSPLHDADYFDYGTVDCIKFEPKHLAQCLCISDTVDDAVVLLNPMVVWPDGEWEAWYFSNSLPGAIRFHSFADWMHSELVGIVDEPITPKRVEGAMPTIFRDGPSKPDRRVVKPVKIPPLSTVLKGLSSPKEAVRAKSVKALARIGGPEAVANLINAMKQDASGKIRCEAAIALGHLKALDAIDALIAAIDDPAINSSAVHSLGQIRNERAVLHLLKLIETRAEYWAVGAYCLSQQGEERSIPLLVPIMLTEHAEHDSDALSAACTLFDHGTETAYNALAPHARHPNPKVRQRALQALNYFAYRSKEKSVTMRARDLLRECAKTETDETLRHWVEGYVSAIPKRK